MKHLISVFFSLIILASCSGPEPGPSRESSFALDSYVEAEDPAFSYEIVETVPAEAWTEYRIHLISGTWLTEEEVDEPQWWHWLTLVVPGKSGNQNRLCLSGEAGEAIPFPLLLRKL